MQISDDSIWDNVRFIERKTFLVDAQNGQLSTTFATAIIF